MGQQFRISITFKPPWRVASWVWYHCITYVRGLSFILCVDAWLVVSHLLKQWVILVGLLSRWVTMVMLNTWVVLPDVRAWASTFGDHFSSIFIVNWDSEMFAHFIFLYVLKIICAFLLIYWYINFASCVRYSSIFHFLVILHSIILMTMMSYIILI